MVERNKKILDNKKDVLFFKLIQRPHCQGFSSKLEVRINNRDKLGI